MQYMVLYDRPPSTLHENPPMLSEWSEFLWPEPLCQCWRKSEAMGINFTSIDIISILQDAATTIVYVSLPASQVPVCWHEFPLSVRVFLLLWYVRDDKQDSIYTPTAKWLYSSKKDRMRASTAFFSYRDRVNWPMMSKMELWLDLISILNLGLPDSTMVLMVKVYNACYLHDGC